MLQNCFEVKCYYVHFPDEKTDRPRGLLRGNPIKILGGQPFQTSALQSSGPHRQRVRQCYSAIPRLRETKIPTDAFSLQVRKLCKNLGGFFFFFYKRNWVQEPQDSEIDSMNHSSAFQWDVISSLQSCQRPFRLPLLLSTLGYNYSYCLLVFLLRLQTGHLTLSLMLVHTTRS